MMKIDESTINHNALRLIEECTSTVYDIPVGEGTESEWMMEMLGEVRGITILAEELKKVLRT